MLLSIISYSESSDIHFSRFFCILCQKEIATTINSVKWQLQILINKEMEAITRYRASGRIPVAFKINRVHARNSSITQQVDMTNSVYRILVYFWLTEYSQLYFL